MKPSARLASILDSLQRRLRDAEKASFAKHLPRGVTAGDVRVLRAVDRVGDQGVSAVAVALGTSQPAATVAIARLETRGLVARAPSSADGRRKQLALTTKGRQVEQAHGQADGDSAEAFLAPLSKGDRAALVELLAKLLE
ncbi:MAG: MarR family transcriptional regulator [Deltaproteobacteria bacterium]|nr:MarR family transcriptional regulator [Deltaproteobacteria bacterium]